jgi:hypothetical protein
MKQPFRYTQGFALVVFLAVALLLYYTMSRKVEVGPLESPEPVQLDTKATLPKVFVYPVPNELLEEGVPRNWREESSMCRYDPGYTLEADYFFLFQQQQTNDPEEADFFFIPHLTTCYFQHCMFGKEDDRFPIHNPKLMHATDQHDCLYKYQPYLEVILDWVIYNYPYYNRSQGMDHVMAVGHETVAESIYTDEPLKSILRFTMLLQVNALLKEYESVVYPGVNMVSFHPRKDISVAPILRTPEYVDYSFTNKLPNHERPIYLYFRGGIDMNNYAYSQGVRQTMYLLGQNDSRVLVDHHVSPDQYLKELGLTRYCLYPPGWTLWSGRLAHILHSGCVPFIINDGVLMPYEEMLDWSTMAVKVMQKDMDQVSNILTELESQGASKVLEENLKRNRHRFVYHSPPQPGDAFYTTMECIQKRLWIQKPTSYRSLNKI